MTISDAYNVNVASTASTTAATRARGMVRKERACASARFQRDSTPDPALAIHFGSSLFALSNDGNALEIILVSILSRNQARNSMTRSEG
jgi:hypothetical protein